MKAQTRWLGVLALNETIGLIFIHGTTALTASQTVPKAPEDTLETRELLMHAGLEVPPKGFAATGIDEVLKRVGAPEGVLLSRLSIARRLSGAR